jgi:hypothetical protein
LLRTTRRSIESSVNAAEEDSKAIRPSADANTKPLKKSRRKNMEVGTEASVYLSAVMKTLVRRSSCAR